MSNQLHNTLRGIGRSMGWLPWEAWVLLLVLVLAATAWWVSRRV